MYIHTYVYVCMYVYTYTCVCVYTYMHHLYATNYENIYQNNNKNMDLLIAFIAEKRRQSRRLLRVHERRLDNVEVAASSGAGCAGIACICI